MLDYTFLRDDFTPVSQTKITHSTDRSMCYLAFRYIRSTSNPISIRMLCASQLLQCNIFLLLPLLPRLLPLHIAIN